MIQNYKASFIEGFLYLYLIMKIIKQIIIATVVFGCLYSCSCLEPPSPEEAFGDADAVFSGLVTNIVQDDSGYYYEVTFQTIDVWKGEDSEEITILTDIYEDTCGYNFQINNEYLVYAYIYASGIYTNICTRTNLLEYATDDLDYLNGISCDLGYTDINGACFHVGDLNVIQKMIDNSYESGVDLGCSDGDYYCGSPNPYMDSSDSWFWVHIDGIYYEWTGNENGMVEPLELGIQEWENGRLTSIMCGAYIYCQLSGPIPEEIGELSEIETLRLEYNYLSGFIPESICELGTDHFDYLSFDVVGNRLCPPYPECIDTSSDFWYQDTSLCSEIGDLNSDASINVQDIIILISFIINSDSYDYQELVVSDINFDGILNVLDVVILVELILNP